MIDRIKMKGIFELSLIDMKDRKNNITIKDDNIIVNTSFDILKNLIVDGDSAYNINRVKIGNGGILNSNIKEALVTETDLYNPLESKDVPVSYSPADVLVDSINKTIKYTWIFETNEGNGAGTRVYNEAGLFSDNGIMFSKKNFSEVIKTSSKKMIINWTIKL